MRALPIVLMFVTLALTGCFGDEGEDADDDDHMDGMDDGMQDGMDDGMGDGMSQTSTTTSTSDPPRDPVTWDLEVADNSFAGGSITIQVGDTVRWTQTGTNPHSVTARDGAFDSHPNCLPVCMTNGDTFTWTFEEVGDWEYYCRVHGSMVETITVIERHDATPSG